MYNKVRIIILAVLASTSLAVVGCESDRLSPLTDSDPLGLEIATKGRDLPEFPPSEDFVDEIDNPHLGFERGKVFTYQGETDEGLETIVVEVTNQTRDIIDVTTTVVHDQVFLNGRLIEDTFDWYAQDSDGNVWYFGEDSREIGENGEVISTEGSWEAGINDASPGIIMLAEPEVGDRYQQELAEDVAEDRARVVSLAETVEVPFGMFENCLKTLEWSPLSPGAREYKYYAPGVGLVLEESTRGGRDRVELTDIDN